MTRTAELNLQSALKKLYYLAAIQTFFALEKNTNIVRMYDQDFNERETIVFKT